MHIYTEKAHAANSWILASFVLCDFKQTTYIYRYVTLSTSNTGMLPFASKSLDSEV